MAANGALRVSVVDDAVQATLSGSSIRAVAARVGMNADDLSDAIDLYRAAGTAALRDQHAQSWQQTHIRFASWDEAEEAAAEHLAPRLTDLTAAGAIDNWWFIRKSPHWRVRYRPGAVCSTRLAREAVDAVLAELAAANHITEWRRTIYEPETLVFGGPPGIDIAHTLFYEDSRNILFHVENGGWRPGAGELIGRRECSMLLCIALFQGAGQDWFEQGDVWHQVTQMRPLPAGVSAERLTALGTNLHPLMIADFRPNGSLIGAGAPLHPINPWVTAFYRAGEHLKEAAQGGTLHRGLRHVLAHHVIFAWNRIGLTATVQGQLAHAACLAALTPRDPARASGG